MLVVLLSVSGVIGGDERHRLATVLASIKQVGDEGGGPSRRADGLAKTSRRRRFAIARHSGRLGRRQPLGGQLAAGGCRGDRCPAACRRWLAADRALEKFLVDRRHAPRSRRLAYEWLVRVDPAAADRLLPGMLDDPSLELRRDAVAQLLEQGQATI